LKATDLQDLDSRLPHRNFAATRRSLIVVLIFTILIPLFFVAAFGYNDHQRRMADASELTERLAHVAQEHALKVVDLNAGLYGRIVDLLGDSDDSAVRSHAADIHERLLSMSGEVPQVSAISVLGENGDLLASSRFFPVPAVSVATRDDFKSARAQGPAPYFSSLPTRLGAQSDDFMMSLGRSARDGRFLGVVSIAIKRTYFENFYHDLLGEDPSLEVGLYRRDGEMLVRYPSVKSNRAPPIKSPFTEAMRDNQLYGRLEMRSTIDGVGNIIAFRRVGDFPLYAATGFVTASVTVGWWQHIALISAIASGPSVAVWLMLLFALRRLRSEQKGWECWQAEVAMRRSIDATNLHSHRLGALGNLVATVAHDFNDLLLVVSSNMQLARTKGFQNVEAEVTAVERATKVAESLTTRLLSVARKQPLRQEPIDLSVWLPDMLRLVQAAVGNNVAVTMDVHSDTWTICMDQEELDLAIINIAVNAREAMRNGGRFTIRCQNSGMSGGTSLLAPGDYVMLSLSDDGEGMPAEVMQRAFEPLFTTKVAGSDTGLGLAQVLASCEQAGGTARIDSVPQSGTTLRLYLPRYRGEVIDTKVVIVPTQHAASTTAVSVLLVEDNAKVAAAVAAVLGTMDCAVHHELTDDAALRTLDEMDTFDLVVSDIHMRGVLTGIELAEIIQLTRPHLTTVLMTGYVEEEVQRARKAGVKILGKPFDFEVLRDIVEKA